MGPPYNLRFKQSYPLHHESVLLITSNFFRESAHLFRWNLCYERRDRGRAAKETNPPVWNDPPASGTCYLRPLCLHKRRILYENAAFPSWQSVLAICRHHQRRVPQVQAKNSGFFTPQNRVFASQVVLKCPQASDPMDGVLKGFCLAATPEVACFCFFKHCFNIGFLFTATPRARSRFQGRELNLSCSCDLHCCCSKAGSFNLWGHRGNSSTASMRLKISLAHSRKVTSAFYCFPV